MTSIFMYFSKKMGIAAFIANFMTAIAFVCSVFGLGFPGWSKVGKMWNGIWVTCDEDKNFESCPYIEAEFDKDNGELFNLLPAI